MQISKIIKAWLKVFKGITTKEDKRRAEICKKCNSAKYSKYMDLIDDELKDVRGLICNDCGCPLIAKIRSTDICHKWKEAEDPPLSKPLKVTKTFI